MTYTAKQQEYIDSVDGNAHQSAIEIIGELEKALREKCDESCQRDAAHTLIISGVIDHLGYIKA